VNYSYRWHVVFQQHLCDYVTAVYRHANRDEMPSMTCQCSFPTEPKTNTNETCYVVHGSVASANRSGSQINKAKQLAITACDSVMWCNPSASSCQSLSHIILWRLIALTALDHSEATVLPAVKQLQTASLVSPPLHILGGRCDISCLHTDS